ncbi:ABC transporter substrate-binding protein [Rhizobiaceae bacterium n13]|uniref:ABC transporter substrate-binding protein n=1 Tax=Ferirhizobium litorale TaxID=2927786 RepID=A0AAE3U0C5_9HYPH|nr:ABC transporter substrate-binding protein [Fererhizobium litorale]MDI7861734.1 ABC transporter substrate-binding protein [Fererhizobium litorale]MDI7921924.1 ABC transporter substrate-binding protein [Fererhizobium litorale]
MKRARRARYVAMTSSLAMLALAAMASADPMDDLIAAAKQEGQLTVIALPRDWCGYGGIIDGFKDKYGLAVNELDPDASSAEEIEAVRTSEHGAGPGTPDVIDIGLSFAASAKEDGLLQPYKVQNWNTIPHSAKDTDGYWYGDYYGTIAFEVNTDLVKNIPTDWADLSKPEYRESVALAGGLESNQAILSIVAAGLSSTNGSVGEIAAQGLKFFAELNRVGNLVPLIGRSDTLGDGRTPIVIRWDYLALSDRDRLRDQYRIVVVRPKTGVVAGQYVQAISAFAPHPNAARLWMEYLFSDEVQLAWLTSHCHPIRYADLARNGKVPMRPDDTVPRQNDLHHDAQPKFPTAEEQEKAREIITNGWDDIVGVEILCQPPEEPPVPMSLKSGPTPHRQCG